MAVYYCMGLFSQDEWREWDRQHLKPLPSTLYHATASYNRIVESGYVLKSRQELRGFGIVGLGGSDQHTISLSSDYDVAKSIYIAFTEVWQIYQGLIGFADLEYMAKHGVGAKRPYWKEFVDSMYATISEGARKPPERWNWYLKGMEYEFQSSLPTTVEKWKARKLKDESPEANAGWEGVVHESDGPHWKGLGLYRIFVRPFVGIEKFNAVYEAYKQWCAWRGYAGGLPDPIFWGSPLEYFQGMDPENIAVIEYRSKPGALGLQMRGMKEWRIVDGRTLEYIATLDRFV